MKFRRMLPYFVLCFSVFIQGCFGPKQPDDLPKLYPCKISVIQDGQPLEGATVLLRPLDGNLRFSMGGKTDQKGIAVIKLDGQWTGAPEGEFHVSISKIVTPEGLALPGPTTSPRERRKLQEESAKMTKETVDPMYSNLIKTTLRLKVDKKATDESFDVGKAVDLSMAELNPGLPQL